MKNADTNFGSCRYGLFCAPRLWRGARKPLRATRNLPWLVCSMILLSFSTATFAQPSQKPPHEAMADATGVITGTVLKDGKASLSGQTVVLEILSGHNLVVTIPKQTDAKGQYQFKNIFMSPEFSYAVSTEYSGKTYRTNFISLKQGEKTRKLDLAVGAGAATGPPLPPPMDEKMGQMMGGADEHVHEHKKGFTEYQLLAIILAVAAVGYAIWQRRKK